MSDPLLQVQDLCVRFSGSGSRALDGISFDLGKDEVIGILGESGAGKTTLAYSLLRLLPQGARVESGSICFESTDLLCTGSRRMRQLRGAKLALIPQEPEMALNPVRTVGTQIEEVIRAHDAATRVEHRDKVRSMMEAVGLHDPSIYLAYPHQLSGGQRQRVAIAQALICEPLLLIADEPTSSLDNVAQADILRLLKALKKRLHLSLLFITHNPALLCDFADRVLVFRDGRIIESGPFPEIVFAARHPFTAAMLRSIPLLPASN